MTERGEASICYGTAYTSQGHMSMLGPDRRCQTGPVILLRGGSQAARSKVMEQVADGLLERGFSLEIYRSSLDPCLTSGFCLLSPMMMVLDGEIENHAGGSDALMPGKVIDIGTAWDYSQLQSQKKALCTLSWQARRRLQIVASYFRELGTILQERKSYVTDSMDFAAVNRTTQQLITEVFSRQSEGPEAPQPSPLFVSAITADGHTHCVNTLASSYKHFYLLRGEPGSGRSTILARVAEQAAMHGLTTRSFHGPLEPNRLELLLIPSLATALVGGVAVRGFRPNDHRELTSLKVVELAESMKKKRLALFQAEWLSATRRFNELVDLTVRELTYCKQTNETVTAIYQEYVDQTRLDDHTTQLFSYLLEFIDKTMN